MRLAFLVRSLFGIDISIQTIANMVHFVLRTGQIVSLLYRAYVPEHTIVFTQFLVLSMTLAPKGTL